jgi:hypothetical protein
MLQEEQLIADSAVGALADQPALEGMRLAILDPA